MGQAALLLEMNDAKTTAPKQVNSETTEAPNSDFSG
jgi:hypothetical protein